MPFAGVVARLPPLFHTLRLLFLGVNHFTVLKKKTRSGEEHQPGDSVHRKDPFFSIVTFTRGHRRGNAPVCGKKSNDQKKKV